MKVTKRYGRTVIPTRDGEWRVRPARVVDDILGALRVERENELYATERLSRYLIPLMFDDPKGSAALLARADVEVRDLAALLARALPAAAEGRLSEELASLLAGVRRLPGGAVEVDSLAAFAAWCLEDVLRAGPANVQTCPNCGLPWLAERGAKFCNRSAPGTRVTCRALRAHERFVLEQGDFHRQRRRLYDRMKRGTLDEQTYRDWLDHNRPGDLGKTWVKFEDWQTGKRPKEGAR